MIGSKRVWMRNTKCMADYGEVQHGFDKLQWFFANAIKKRNSIKRWTTFRRIMAGRSNPFVRSMVGRYQVWDLRNLDIRTRRKRRLARPVVDVARIRRQCRTRRHRPAHTMAFSRERRAQHSVQSCSLFVEPEAHSVMAEVVKNVRAERDFLLLF